MRDKAGRPTYRELSARAHYSEATLSQAAAGRKLPSLAVTLAYVRACDGEEEPWRERWQEVADELAEPVPDAERDASPYVGLAAFQREDAELFFGREELVDDVLRRLARQRLVGLFGASGSGKSSVLRAGVLPRLDQALLITPGARPLEECAIGLAHLLGDSASRLHAELVADRRGLLRLIRHAAADDGFVLVVDQFEEVFTLCADDERARFLDALLAVAQDEHSLSRVLIGVRADFYGHCADHPGLVEALRDGQVAVGPMTPAQRRLAITGPAAKSGLIVESALVTELVARTDGAGVLPLLSHALLETWLRRRGNTLTLAGFQAAGGIDGALAQTAEAVYTGLTESGREPAKNLLLRLIAPGEGTEDTKRRIARTELDADTDEVLDRLAAARLVSLGDNTVEIAHEALIRAWPRLRDWLSDDREGLRLHRRLTEAAEAWHALDRDSGALYRGLRLARARDWAARHDSALTAREREFVRAGLAAQAAEHDLDRRRSRRLRRLVALLSVLLVFAVTVTAYAVNAQQDAARRRDAALSRVAAGKAAVLRRTDPALAVQVALAAYRLSPTAEARDGLLGSFPLPYAHRVRGHTDNVNSVVFSPDGRTMATASHDHTAKLWDATDPGRVRESATLAGHRDNVNTVAFSPTRPLVATASWDDTARLWDVADRRHPVPLAVLTGHTDHVNTAAFSPDDRMVATAGSDGTARLWDVTDPRAPVALATLRGHEGIVVSVAFSADGRRLATVSRDGKLGLWDIGDPRRPGPPTRLTGHTAPAVWLAFSPDHRFLVTTGEDRTARLWDMATLRSTALTAHDGIVRGAAFTSDGRLLATAASDQTARLWDVSDPFAPKQTARLEGHTEPIVSVAVTGHTLATASDDDTVALWRLPDSPPDRITIEQAAAWVCEMGGERIPASDWSVYFPGVAYRPPC
ncbi:hypothetical protein ACQPZF_15390 [Actinosynnema sp. CS-041913]|uniref:nSTAND1 domain-containing NTPase n=1 Tax=Actinosynnema sp. CS-041913 TaxID=3239917 RepID=UPI003D92E084